MLSITTGQFVICITNGHIEIELNGVSDCEQACDNPVEEQNASSTDNTTSCSLCTDTIVTLDNIVKSKDDGTICGKCFMNIYGTAHTDAFTDYKESNSYFYLHNYKNTTYQLEIRLTETTVFLI
jgi:hypothetical protein